MSFDHLASWYRALEFVTAGELLQKCRLSHLAACPAVKSALLVGEGPGRFLQEFVRRFPSAQVTYLDGSPRMLQVAQRHLFRAELSDRPVDFVCADILQWEGAPGRFDLISTHFFLDCFRAPELKAVISKLAGCAAAQAVWLVSDFREPERGWKRQRARIVLKLAYAFFQITTGLSAHAIVPPGSLLEAQGFELRSRRLYHHELLYADIWTRGVLLKPECRV